MAEQPSPTLLLSPTPDGCAWLPNTDIDVTPRCSEPVAYLLTCVYTGMTTGACVDHTAAMRALHPDWIAQVVTAQSAPYTPTERD